MISLQTKAEVILRAKYGWNKEDWWLYSLMNTIPFLGLAISRFFAPLLIAKGRRKCLMITPWATFIAIIF
jgi:hypothetical protein